MRPGPAIQIGDGTKISVRSSGLQIRDPDHVPSLWKFETLSLRSPDYPQATDGDFSSSVGLLYPVDTSAQVSVTLPSPPTFRVSLVLAGGALALRVAAGGNTVTVRLTDGQLVP